jgi:periplasmic divalent cation tolerance protein
MDQPEAVVVLTTWPAAKDPGPAATALVEERLAACVSILPEMESIYRWQGAVMRDRERQLVIKTTPRQVAALTARLQDLHPYDLPELIVLRVSGGSPAYLAWLTGATAPS